jgi:hypothetical protein
LVKTATGKPHDAARGNSFFSTPERVLYVLDSLYPGPKEVRWSKKGKRYTADFIYGGLNFSNTFNRNGNLITSVEEISFELLPAQVKDKVNRFYKSYKIVIVLQRKIRDKLEYDIEVIQGQHQYILNYHPKGFLIHQYEVTKHKYDRLTTFSD